ncbi:hypothetical protein [Terrisporobacter mayombei]|uniref:hypothetical protein n=1 Tax=Terrisporobacter mayombei TaxID=1541 RepID=UPI0026597AA8|nr:hypothetical protein [Terrisporobacter mayombei]MCC3668070.1 hypothetical protein [Terrisporobacter mayombei]
MESLKINSIYNGDVKVNTSTIMVVEVGDLRFEMDERFPWINVFITDNTDLGYSLIDEIEEIEPIMNHEDLAVIAMNYYFKNVNIATEKQMKELISKEKEIKTAQEGQVQEQQFISEDSVNGKHFDRGQGICRTY